MSKVRKYKDQHEIKHNLGKNSSYLSQTRAQYKGDIFLGLNHISMKKRLPILICKICKILQRKIIT